MTTTTLTGACLCGSVLYTVVTPPKSVSLSHCRSCRKQSGSNRSMNWLVPVDDLVITGELSTYRDVGDSGDGLTVKDLQGTALERLAIYIRTELT
jgi:hypothetical protein